MALINQVFNLGKSIENYSSAKKTTEHMYRYAENKNFTQEEAKEYSKKLKKQEDKALRAGVAQTKSAIGLSISALSFGYNYYIAVSRFGQRGKDIQDQNRIQDRMVNKSLGVLGATLVAGPAGPLVGAVAVASFAFDEVIRTIIQDKAYEYRKRIDEEQKAIARERIGRSVVNSSRRSYV